MRTITIQGKEWKLAFNLRSLFVYEEMAGKPYTGDKTIENYRLFLAMLLANNEDFSMDMGEFIDACDADMGLFHEFTEVMAEQAKRSEAFLENKKKAVTQ